MYTTLQELVRDIVLTLSNFSYYAAVATPTMQEVLRVRPVLFRALESLAARPLATPLTSDDRLQHFLDKESGDMLEVATFLQRHHLQLFGSNVRTSRPPPIAVVRAAELSLRLAAAAPSGSAKPASVTGNTTRLHGDVAAAKKGPSGPARKRRLSDASSAAALGTPPPSDPGSDAEDSDASSVTSRVTKRAPDSKHAPADDADPGVAAAGGAGDNDNDREGEAQDRTARALKRPRPLSSVGRAGSAKRLQAELKPEPLADDVDAVANAGDAGAADDFEWQYDPIGNAEPGQPMFHIAVPKGQAQYVGGIRWPLHYAGRLTVGHRRNWIHAVGTATSILWRKRRLLNFMWGSWCGRGRGSKSTGGRPWCCRTRPRVTGAKPPSRQRLGLRALWHQRRALCRPIE